RREGGGGIRGCAPSWWRSPHSSKGRRNLPDVMRVSLASPRPAMGTRLRREPEDPTVLPWFGWGDPVRTPGNDEQASSVARARGWKAGREQKSPLRRFFKPRPPGGKRSPGF